MKIYNSCIIALILAHVSSPVLTQEYVRMTQDDVLYDVDVIVFSRQLAQPSAESVNNAVSIKTAEVLTLPVWDRALPLIRYINNPDTSDSEWEVPLTEQAQQVDVLTWLILNNSMNHSVINKLSTNPTIKPLFHQKWRQPASSFLQPQYVNLSQMTTRPILDNNSEFSSQKLSLSDEIYADNSIDGQIAFSKQRFKHLHVKMNLYRVNSEGKQIVYKLSQQKRIELGEWQYFDHQQMGILAKVTAVEFETDSES